ncbi:4-vinyl reductase [Rudaea sp.]|uniref:4-vinyl reductase n=1 Tax=Rudaea sp. TaxID=2136325 RepID=UPI002ED40FFB
MFEVQIRIFASGKEGLMLEVGRIVIESGFALLRQSLNESDGGFLLTLTLRGPETALPELEERIAMHRLVRSIDFSVCESAVEPPEEFDSTVIEKILPKLAQTYPRILPDLVSFSHSLPANSREYAMYHVGRRIGAWVYKRDFALGARLALADAMRHVVLPAARQLVLVELDIDGVRMANSPFCGSAIELAQRHRRGCHFFLGYFEGLLNAGRAADRPVKVVETICRNSGASQCVFAITE